MTQSVPFCKAICKFPEPVSENPLEYHTDHFVGPSSWHDFKYLNRYVATNQAMRALIEAGIEALKFEQSMAEAPQKAKDAMTNVLGLWVRDTLYGSERLPSDDDMLTQQLASMSVGESHNNDLVLSWPRLWETLDQARRSHLETCRLGYAAAQAALGDERLTDVTADQRSTLCAWLRGRHGYHASTSLLMLSRVDEQTRVPAIGTTLARLSEEVPVGSRFRVVGSVDGQDVTLCAIGHRSVEWTAEGEVQRLLAGTDETPNWVEDENLANAMEGLTTDTGPPSWELVARGSS